jgi:hypothetical protein
MLASVPEKLPQLCSGSFEMRLIVLSAAQAHLLFVNP